MTTTPSAETLDVDCDVLRPGDAEYDTARQVYNTMHDARPAMIVRCVSEADVAAALGFAREQGLSVCVRAGGHSVPGFSVVDDALVVDVRRLKSPARSPAPTRRRRSSACRRPSAPGTPTTSSASTTACSSSRRPR